MVSKVNLWKIATSAQIATASVSFITSCATVIMIMRNPNGEGRRLNSPQRRIFFGLVSSHIIQNIGFITGPFAGKPSAPTALWAIGNDWTCIANGILVLLPKPALYSSFLAVFYVCKIRFNMTDVTFTNTFEWVIHTLIQLYGLSITIAACVTNSINTAASGTLCMHAPLPTGCRINPDLFGECDPVLERTTSKFRIASNAVIFLSFSVTAMSLIWICLHTYRVLKIASPSRGEASHSNSSIPRLSDSTTPRSDLAYNKNTLEKWDNLKKETVRQAIFFIATYLFIYTPLITYRFMHNKGSALGFIVSSMYPLHGLLTVFVYTHPKVASLRRIDPSVSWLRAFRLVLMAGGEIPKKPNPNSSSQDNETPKIIKRKRSSHHDNELGRFVNGDGVISSFPALLSTNGAVAGSDSHSYPFRDHKLDKIPENQMISSGLVIADVSSPAPEEI